MPLFTSRRERRLWLGAGVVVAIVYATLGPAQAIAAALRARGLLGPTLTLALALLGAAIAWRWARHRPGRAEIGVALAVAAAALILWARVETPEERTHLIEYALVGGLVLQALRERFRPRRRELLAGGLAFAITVAVGGLDEAIQALVPGRVFDPVDIGFNTLAAAMAVGGGLAVGAARRWRRSG